MRIVTLYDAFLQEFSKMRCMEREVIAFVPKLMKASAHPKLIHILTQQREGAQSLLGVLAHVKYGKKSSDNNKVIKMLIAEGIHMLGKNKPRHEQDIKISTFTEKMLGHEIGCCSCLVSMASKLSGLRKRGWL